MANFEAPVLQGTVSTGFKSAGLLWVSSAVQARRLQLYEVEFGQTGSLASTDCQCQWDLSRFGTTAVAAGAGVIPNALDPADSSPLAQFLNAISAELTYTTAGNGLALKSWGINQRGSYRWRALDDGDNIVVPATNLFGVGLRTASSNFTGSAIGNISFIER